MLDTIPLRRHNVFTGRDPLFTRTTTMTTKTTDKKERLKFFLAIALFLAALNPRAGISYWGLPYVASCTTHTAIAVNVGTDRLFNQPVQKVYVTQNPFDLKAAGC